MHMHMDESVGGSRNMRKNTQEKRRNDRKVVQSDDTTVIKEHLSVYDNTATTILILTEFGNTSKASRS